jgi:chromosome segregation ATPase
MIFFLVFLTSLLSSGAIGYLTFFRMKGGNQSGESEKEIEEAFRSLQDLLARLEAAKPRVVAINQVLPLVKELETLDDELKNKNVKVSIVLSELEAVEFRLQELEEIRREVEVSAAEIKDELRALQEREAELRSRREELESMLQASVEKMSTIASELSMSDEMQMQIERMQGELVSTQDQCDKLLVQIQQGNEQCIAMKQRYNALDIEYALLYERFARLESAR